MQQKHNEIFTCKPVVYYPSCSTVFLEKLTGFQIVKKFPTLYGTRRFIISFRSARILTLS